MFFGNQKKEIKDKTWESILSLGMGAALATISLAGTNLGKKAAILKYSKQIQLKD
ncbi:MAG: hypothetical protein R3A80_13560 [Bdellovibrionota bacterium]